MKKIDKIMVLLSLIT